MSGDAGLSEDGLKHPTKTMTVSEDVMIEMTGVHKWFGSFHVLKDINLTVNKGERIVICGPSGSGKSTLIRCINRLEEHQKGEIFVDGVELTGDLNNIEIVRSEVGIVFQQFNLFPHLTVLENCSLALIWVRKIRKAEAEEIAMKHLERVRIPEQAAKYPGQLSGGQQQRVAIARALVNQPALLLADEPTGALDSRTGIEIMALFQALNRAGNTIIVVTHDEDVAAFAKRTIRFRDGQVIADQSVPAPKDAGAMLA